MEVFKINGGNKLRGTVKISGAKNAAVAIVPASILIDGVCRIENLPNIQDVNYILDILEKIGSKINRIDEHTVEIDNTNVNTYVVTDEIVQRMRASYYLVGALLGRFKRAAVSLPGGCNFGERPIDLHVKGFQKLGANVEVGDTFEAYADRLIGTNIYLDQVSVGATMNIMIAAVLAEGVTTIENAAKEPHIVDAANFLNSMGADIKGAGTDTIKIRGVESLGGGSYSLIPDQIEVGTFMMASVITGGDVTVDGVIPKHMEAIVAKLIEMGAQVIEDDESIRVIGPEYIKHTNVKTMPYPGFPTDLQPLIVSLLALGVGTSIVNENVWENRFQYVDELRKMGANIIVTGRTAVIQGVPKFEGSKVRATDLRAGAAMVISALAAEGESIVHDIKYVDRGYEYFEDKLKGLGADIERVEI